MPFVTTNKIGSLCCVDLWLVDCARIQHTRLLSCIHKHIRLIINNFVDTLVYITRL